MDLKADALHGEGLAYDSVEHRDLKAEEPQGKGKDYDSTESKRTGRLTSSRAKARPTTPQSARS